MFEQVQEKLGEINDHAAGCSLFEQWSVEHEDPLAAAQFRERAAAERGGCLDALDRFQSWWTPQRAEALRQQLQQYAKQISTPSPSPG